MTHTDKTKTQTDQRSGLGAFDYPRKYFAFSVQQPMRQTIRLAYDAGDTQKKSSSWSLVYSQTEYNTVAARCQLFSR
ncbi:MAG: hypothetical protein HY070_02625 [Chloroflexi bacterium]|nr:hypothetical protein [Chloroflexota bacterium]